MTLFSINFQQQHHLLLNVEVCAKNKEKELTFENTFWRKIFLILPEHSTLLFLVIGERKSKCNFLLEGRLTGSRFQWNETMRFVQMVSLKRIATRLLLDADRRQQRVRVRHRRHCHWRGLTMWQRLKGEALPCIIQVDRSDALWAATRFPSSKRNSRAVNTRGNFFAFC